MSEYSTKKKRSSENFRLLPVEITTDIMLRLPLKSLLTCTAVCKSWNSLFKSLFKTSDFIEDHLNATIQFYRQNDVHNLLIRKQVESYSLYRNNPSELGTSDQYVELPYPSKFKADFQSFHDRTWLRRVVGTCNGLVCLAGATEDITIIIWNPTVRKFVILPRPVDIFNYDENPRQTHHAFGHDPRNNDYKVLRIVSDRKEEPAVRVEVYSLARGSWRSLLAAAVPTCFKPADEFSYFINGASHWIQKTSKRVGKRRVKKYVIMLFNMETELFGEIQMPEALRKRTPFSSCFISKHDECLALIETTRGINGLEVWVMKEYGVVESWTRLYMISELSRFPRPPFGFKSSCELVYQVKGYNRYIRKLSPKILNLVDGEVKEFEIDQHPLEMDSLFSIKRLEMDSFVQSLVLFDQPNATSY